jgi:hypothetical protein
MNTKNLILLQTILRLNVPKWQEMEKEDLILLQSRLTVTVPQWQEIIEKDFDFFYDQRKYFVEVITLPLYKAKSKKSFDELKTEETAFNELAKAIALLSFNPAGITIFGINFTVKQTFIGELNSNYYFSEN